MAGLARAVGRLAKGAYKGRRARKLLTAVGRFHALERRLPVTGKMAKMFGMEFSKLTPRGTRAARRARRLLYPPT